MTMAESNKKYIQQTTVGQIDIILDFLEITPAALSCLKGEDDKKDAIYFNKKEVYKNVANIINFTFKLSDDNKWDDVTCKNRWAVIYTNYLIMKENPDKRESWFKKMDQLFKSETEEQSAKRIRIDDILIKYIEQEKDSKEKYQQIFNNYHIQFEQLLKLQEKILEENKRYHQQKIYIDTKIKLMKLGFAEDKLGSILNSLLDKKDDI